jgi:hypothetical protein
MYLVILQPSEACQMASTITIDLILPNFEFSRWMTTLLIEEFFDDNSKWLDIKLIKLSMGKK